MKPLTLTMKNFLGFKEETHVDFQGLFEEKIFLITGPTGAGKTSIFDALCYGLYGEGSGEVRSKAKCYRSHMAGEKEDLEVSLLFQVRGKRYFVKRSESAKGLNKAYFTLEGEEANALTKIREVNQEIETILGLTIDQFKKIVMIPQGEFREFLTAGTKEKSEILKKLFATEQYEEIQLAIKDKYDEKKALEKELVLRFKEILEESSIEGKDIEMGKDALQERLQEEASKSQKIKEEKDVQEKDLKLLEQEITLAEKNNEDYETYQGAKKNFENLYGQKRHYEKKEQEVKLMRSISGIVYKENQWKEKGQELKELEQELHLLQDEKRRLSSMVKPLEKKLQEVEEAANTLDHQKARKNHVESLLNKSIRLQEVLKAQREVKKAYDQQKSMLDHLSKKEVERQGIQEKQRMLSQEMSEYELKLERLNHADQAKEKELKELINLYKHMEKAETIEKDILEAEKKRQVLLKEQRMAEEVYVREKNKQQANYALQLRKDLKEETPCPVCGSTHHPLAEVSEEAFSAIHFDEAEKRKHQIEQALATMAQDVKHLTNQHKDLLADIEEEKAALSISYANAHEVGIHGQKERAQKKHMEEQLLQEMSKKNRYTTLKNQFNDQLMELENLLRKMEEEQKKGVGLEEKLHQLQGERNGLEREGVPKEPSMLQGELEKLTKQIKAIEEEREETRKKWEALMNQREKLVGRESTLEETKERAIEKEGLLKTDFLESLQKEGVSEEMYTAYKGQVGTMEALIKEVQRFFNEYNQMKGVYESLKEKGASLVYKDLAPLKKTYGQKQFLVAEILERQNAQSILLHNLQKAHDRLGTLHERYMENKEALVLYQDLYDTAYLGMNFETFVQSYYFEGILTRANMRLRKMSEGRYELRRRAETESRREKIGLGLNVFDEYTGRERDVQSLSGGESFKASLALALGLSDFIESHKGSINLETIFIDEGFGSLDQDSLEHALSCLMELNVSGRIVGIISHVTELKDRIPGKIEVRTSPGMGSTLKISGGKIWN